MSLREKDVVDLVTVFPEDPRIALIAYDAGDVPNAEGRERALQKKLAAYLRFVVSGQFAREYAGYLDREPFVLVICVNPPTEGMKKIKGIRDHAHPETCLAVEVISHDDFSRSLANAASERRA